MFVPAFKYRVVYTNSFIQFKSEKSRGELGILLTVRDSSRSKLRGVLPLVNSAERLSVSCNPCTRLINKAYTSSARGRRPKCRTT